MGYVLFYVENVTKTVEFYKSAFFMEIDFLHEAGDYAQMKTGETKLGFISESLASEHFSFEKRRVSIKPGASEIALISSDVKKSFAHAIKNGAKSLLEPVDKPWGQTICYVQDCNGFTVEICSEM